MITVELHNLILHGHHGIFEEEKKVMNTFEVNLSVKYDEKRSDFNRIEDTISYVDLYEIVKQKIGVPVFLLEKLCQEIIHKIKNQYPSVREVNISIYKMQAPIENFQGKAGVSMRKKFDD
ncbi:MAG TPA: dihydroneopterin aldolase [Puia sp.]|nr:dihydroneopterin aldolase [Puia sp.]